MTPPTAYVRSSLPTGTGTGSVAAVGSVAEAVATVASSLPPGRVVVPERDFSERAFLGTKV
jgi:hypothetical protein